MKLIKSTVLLAVALVFITPHSQAQVDTFASPHFPGKKQPSLYVLSIGVPFVNLKYTVKDARDFASIFETQGGRNLMYKEVHTTTLTQKSETTRLEIRKAFRELQSQFKAGTISENDVLLVFISTHGMLAEDNQLLLLDSRANKTDEVHYDRELAMNYEQDILNLMKTIKCHRFLFMDACYSGAIKDMDRFSLRNPDVKQRRINEAIIKLAEADPEIKTMVSCSADEVSWESPEWENGLFAKVLKEAFANSRSSSDLVPDADHNRILTMGEIYNFTKNRSLQVMRTIFKNGEFTQTPYMPASHLLEDLPIFVLGTK